MFDIARIASPTAIAPRYDATTTVPGTTPAPPQAPAEATPPPPAGTGKKNDALGRNEFLQLLVAQMKNQDPLNPMNGQEMAAQLAQFSQVEQLIDINESLQTVAGSQVELGLAIEDLSSITIAQGDAMAKLLEQSMAINTVGRGGVVEGNQMFVDRGGNGTIGIDSGALEGVGRLRVLDEDGKIIATKSISDVKAGMQTIELAEFGFDPPLKQGRYSFEFQMENDKGQNVMVKTYTTGRITGLRYEQGVPMLMLGDSLSVPFSSLLQLRS